MSMGAQRLERSGPSAAPLRTPGSGSRASVTSKRFTRFRPMAELAANTARPVTVFSSWDWVVSWYEHFRPREASAS